MNILLDTHIFLWSLQDNPKLSKQARKIICSADSVYISSASIWEMTIKIKLGKLDANIDTIVEAIIKSNYTELPITANHAAAIAELPNIHRDPFDRMMVAQAITEPLRFLTSDTLLQQYSDLVMLV